MREGSIWTAMRFETTQNLRLSQQMKLAPRMIQSMEILQMPLLELQDLFFVGDTPRRYDEPELLAMRNFLSNKKKQSRLVDRMLQHLQTIVLEDARPYSHAVLHQKVRVACLYVCFTFVLFDSR